MTRLLGSLRNDALARVPKTVETVRRAGANEDLAPLVRQFCEDLHLLAVAALLIDAKPSMFFLNLCRCGENWRRYLAYRRDRDLSPERVTFLTPLLAAVAAGDWQIAVPLAELAASGVRGDTDYEDEFLHARLLAQWVASAGSATDAARATAEQLGEVDQGEFAGRLAIVEAVMAGDKADFEEAFLAATDEYGQTMEKQAGMVTIPDTRLAPHRFLWLEGLALLRLAERAGLATEPEYAHCPALARIAMPEPYAGDWTLMFPGP